MLAAEKLIKHWNQAAPHGGALLEGREVSARRGSSGRRDAP